MGQVSKVFNQSRWRKTLMAKFALDAFRRKHNSVIPLSAVSWCFASGKTHVSSTLPLLDTTASPWTIAGMSPQG